MFELKKIQLSVDLRTTSAFTQGYAFVDHQGGQWENPPNDFWINIPLHRTYEISEYVDVQKDNRIQRIERQEINPFYLEYAFFDDIQRNKTNRGSELTDAMVNFILSKRADLQEMNGQQIRDWFDLIGKNELPWTTASGLVTIDDIEKSQIVLTSIISRANHLKIDIHS